MNDEPRATILSTETEALPDYLRRRERELIPKTAAPRGMLIPTEKELDAVRQSMEVVGIQRSYGDELTPFLDDESQSRGLSSHTAPKHLMIDGVAVNFTIKEMILAVLKDHFRTGATPVELRDYFKAVYGRDVDRASISPQLARSRDNGMISQSPEGFWRLPNSVAEKQIKEMIVQAFLNRFQKNAAVTALADLIRKEFGRFVETSNLLRQLHSLREDKIVIHEHNRDTWALDRKFREYFMLPDGPGLRGAMRKLQDDSDIAPQSPRPDRFPSPIFSAHKPAGAASARHSLRPLFSEGRE
jgi:hypothetical protein